jgi:hypothetical protein
VGPRCSAEGNLRSIDSGLLMIVGQDDIEQHLSRFTQRVVIAHYAETVAEAMTLSVDGTTGVSSSVSSCSLPSRLKSSVDGGYQEEGTRVAMVKPKAMLAARGIRICGSLG